MPTFEVIVQTRHGEESVIVEAATRQAAYSAASHATGGAAVDSRQLYSPAERAANRVEIQREREEWHARYDESQQQLEAALQPILDKEAAARQTSGERTYWRLPKLLW